MKEKMSGSIHLFRIVGIDVFLHFSWFLVAIYEIQGRVSQYSSIFWNVLEYLALFLLVLLHEFGHALACRQTGGQANRIMLWPLGGIAYVSPPQRPGATLWSIAAGPLVNEVLFPVLEIIVRLGETAGWAASMPDVFAFFYYLRVINLVVLIFNLLPIYPLDGGQILHSLLWFKFGKAKSLMIAASIGLFGVGAIVLFALWVQSMWIGIVAIFIFMNCWNALKAARSSVRRTKAPRREGFSCPHCNAAPQIGSFWICPNCKNYYDVFGTDMACPHCRTPGFSTICQECGEIAPISAWSGSGIIGD